MNRRLRQQVEVASDLLRATIQFLMAVVLAGGWISLEHPEDRGRAPFPSIWDLDLVKELEGLGEMWRCNFDQCRFGLSYKKGTCILTNVKPLAERLSNCRCTHRDGHPPLQGVGPDGRFRSSLAQEYPAELNEALARGYLEVFRLVKTDHTKDISLEDEAKLRSEIFATRKEEMARKVPVPAVDVCWDPIDRWKETLRVKWSRDEHQNVLELRTVVLALRRAISDTSSWERRHLVITDSLVSIGSASKGRSSSPSLLRILRQLCGYLLLSGCLLVVRWIESQRNHADGPSRNQKIGQAVKEKKAPRVVLPVGCCGVPGADGQASKGGHTAAGVPQLAGKPETARTDVLGRSAALGREAEGAKVFIDGAWVQVRR